MNGAARQQVIIPLELFFGAKLVVTATLIVYMTRHPSFTANSPLGPIAFVLFCLVVLQGFIMVGLVYRMEVARQLGVGVCISGGTIGGVLCLLALLAGFYGLFVIAVGLPLLLLNGFALAALLSRSVREYCDVKPGRPGPE